jgi:hypothetical protein
VLVVPDVLGARRRQAKLGPGTDRTSELSAKRDFGCPRAWIFARQDDGIDTYVGPIADTPANPMFRKLKVARDLFVALSAPSTSRAEISDLPDDRP